VKRRRSLGWGLRGAARQKFQATSLPEPWATSAAGRAGSLILRAQGDLPISLPIADHLDLPWLTAHRTVLDVVLPRAAGRIDVDVHFLAAIGAARPGVLTHHVKVADHPRREPRGGGRSRSVCPTLTW
jgi:hypothetical protein